MRPEHDARRGKGGTSMPSNAVGTLSDVSYGDGDQLFDFLRAELLPKRPSS